jgi:hypothetical protein
MRCVVLSTPLNPAVSAKGTVRPSDMPMMMSFTRSEFERRGCLAPGYRVRFCSFAIRAYLSGRKIIPDKGLLLVLGHFVRIPCLEPDVFELMVGPQNVQ